MLKFLLRFLFWFSSPAWYPLWLVGRATWLVLRSSYVVSIFRFRPSPVAREEVVSKIHPTLNEAVFDTTGEFFAVIEPEILAAYAEVGGHYDVIERKANTLLYGYLGLHALVFSLLSSKFSSFKLFWGSVTAGNSDISIFASLLLATVLGWVFLVKVLKVSTFYVASQDALFPGLANPKDHKAYVLMHKWWVVVGMRQSVNFMATNLFHAQMTLIAIVFLSGIAFWVWGIIELTA